MATDKEIIEGLKNELALERAVITLLKAELKHVCIKNIKLKMHMNVLVKTPECTAAKKIRLENGGKLDFSESILHMN
jgi:hypothetical protein